MCCEKREIVEIVIEGERERESYSCTGILDSFRFKALNYKFVKHFSELFKAIIFHFYSQKNNFLF